MDYRSPTSRYILTVLAIILMITTFILIGLNAFNIQGRFVTGKSYNDGFLAAREMYQKMCPNFIGEAKSISGVVTSVQGGSFVLKQDSLDTSEEVDGVSDSRTIAVAESTKFVKYDQKSTEQMQKDLDAFIKARNENNQPTPPPSLNTVRAMTFADIQVGQRVSVVSDSDVRLKEVISATTVTLQ